MRKFLSIAGSDCCGGAGVQADMYAAIQYGLFPMSVITALTAQTHSGVRSVQMTQPEFIAEQIDAVFSDCNPDVIKIGMLGNRETVEIVANKLLEYNAKIVVLDTVFISSSGYELLNNEGITALKEKLLPLCDVITPNISEAEVLADMKVNSKADMEQCAVKLSNVCSNVIITGGHLEGCCDDLLFVDSEFTWLNGERIDSDNTHGTGCAFSSALACSLAMGQSLEESMTNAKRYVVKWIREG